MREKSAGPAYETSDGERVRVNREDGEAEWMILPEAKRDVDGEKRRGRPPARISTRPLGLGQGVTTEPRGCRGREPAKRPCALAAATTVRNSPHAQPLWGYSRS